ncbi:hypothetical protein ASPZODRAFT_1172448 [Penicilliopsis zonata CBS 506.65]|uniref:Nephrocystin 3-like N-terminal domain-containing protein n=1 Tax=Penicilliopsis zonata CBS 506.65 TaxID=1073090 RepID=A0A1L9S7T8_9EURO|nr:hypothetical protein ASPZODRAFT_1172448 [Penicilliopsis zonata CBS 506.65]OJJ43204.1 hypothetical protein ASPZODRAFT_1172448 [Penicilliopsis zonata CBS 506.65]
MNEYRALSREIQQDTRKIQEDFQSLTLIRNGQFFYFFRQSLELTRTAGEQNKVLDWLSPIDVSERHRAARAKHEPTTGDWLVESTEMKMWLANSMEFMWIHGIPGAGKTVLCSTIIENVQKICRKHAEPKPACIYYYFDFGERERQTMVSFVRSILAQLSRQYDTLPADVQELYQNRSKRGQEPTTDQLVETLFTLLKRPE